MISTESAPMIDAETFATAFSKLTGHVPFCWQKRLFEKHFLTGALPLALDLPTGLGKTSVMAIWYLARKAGAPVPRRLVYVVDRRAVVDQATQEAEKIKAKTDARDLRVSTLRGQFADNGDWRENPAAPAIIVGTVDMIGSRLLFEGYGVSRRMRPYHAGLLGTDTLVVLDESHLVPPFERLLQQIAENGDLGPKDEADRAIILPFRLLPLSATGRDRDGDVFRLTEEDQEDLVVKARLDAKKRLTFEPAFDKKLEERLAEEAWALSAEGKAPVRILTYCNSRDVAEKTRDALEKLAKPVKIAPENLQLFVGARRVKEREDAKNRLQDLGFFSGNDAPDKPAFVIATSAGEVGVDLDADHMVMDLVPFERMVQRLGRVNRLGGEDREARVVVFDPDKSLPDDLRIRAERCQELLQELRRHEDGSHDASPGALSDLKRNPKESVDAASSPEPLYPALTHPLVDAWSMTSLYEHTGRPQVQPWLRGWVDDEPQTTLVWRTYLPVRTEGGEATEREVNDFFAAAPPHLSEQLETESYRVHDWLKKCVQKLMDDAEKPRRAGREEQLEGEKTLKKTDVVTFLLGKTNEYKRRFTVGELAQATENKNRFVSEIAGMTLVLDARIGGLSDDGLFDAKAAHRVRVTVDGAEFIEDEERRQVEEWQKRAGLRVRSVAPDTEEAHEDWHKPYNFETRRDEEGNPLWLLRVEKYKDMAATEEERSLTPTAQSLSQHQKWAADKAKTLVEALGLRRTKPDLAEAIVTAARLHDEGKRAERWQRAFNAPRDGKVYAKTKGPLRHSVLAGYRHELGSLFHLEKDNEFGALSDDMKDLVRHLIAAHHGRARPVLETEGCEDGPPSLLEARARDVTLRFARLQKRFGPWGLAWLEALLRAADRQASRDLDQGRTPDG